jgi:ppGpp synthetase/RelA/SpoT-type nucleotidyltranferase
MQLRPPNRRMSLGWSLGLSTALIVVLVMGILNSVQQWRDIRRDWKDRVTLLTESLVPMAADVEAATTLEEIRQRVSTFQQAYLMRGYTSYCFDLRDGEGRIIVSSSSTRDGDMPSWTLRASIPISSSLLPRGRGTLTVWQKDSKLKAEVERRWVFWLLDLGVAVLCILASLQLAHHYLVARPLRCLMESIRHMEMGYWRGVKIPSGAWEMQWLAYRFQQLGARLDETMQLLVQARRRACRDLHGSPDRLAPGGTEDITCLEDVSVPGEAPVLSDKDALFQELGPQNLLDKCRFLECRSPLDPAAQALAREVWEKDVLEAERLCENGLKCRLENAAFRILNPEAFEQLTRDLRAMVSLRKRWTRAREQEIRKVLERHQLSCLEIQHRVKHLAGIWRKMQAKGLSLDQIHDIFAFRIIVSEEQECYLVLDAIHQHFEPLLLRFKDYIARPKANGYKSIHTCVSGSDHFVFEVQIRTAEMHEEAEGAHWQYKAAQPSNGPPPSPLSRGWGRWKARFRRRSSLKNGRAGASSW